MDRISIVIPALNEAEGIACAVDRAWASRPYEVLVVDGGSNDDTAGIAAQAGATVFVASRGRAVQQNLGSRHARGDIFLFLHADTWLPEEGCRQIESALANPQAQCGAFQQQIQAKGVAYRWLEHGNAWRARRLGIPYGDQGIFVRRQAFEGVGRFPEVGLMEDWLLMRRLRRRSWPILLKGPLFVSARRWQQHGVVRQTLRNWCLVTAATLGVSPDRLADFYRPHKENAVPLTTERPRV